MVLSNNSYMASENRRIRSGIGSVIYAERIWFACAANVIMRCHIEIYALATSVLASPMWWNRVVVVPASDITLSCGTALFHGGMHEIFGKNANKWDAGIFNTRPQLHDSVFAWWIACYLTNGYLLPSFIYFANLRTAGSRAREFLLDCCFNKSPRSAATLQFSM